jgi:signal recognition particle subunit SRP54
MFDTLSDKLQDTFRKLRGKAHLSESNIQEAMREIRLALLEADVNIEIVKEFIKTVSEDCIGHEVVKSVTPAQQLTKIVNDRLVELMGEAEVPLSLTSSPSVIMMVGLHGSGKTTSTAKLALRLKKALDI